MMWLGAALAQDCDLRDAPDGRFEVKGPPASPHVRLLIEVWPEPGQEVWAGRMLQALEERRLHGALVVAEPASSPGLVDLALAVALRGHEVVLALDTRSAPRDELERPRSLRASLKALDTESGRPRAVSSPMVTADTEPFLARAGFRTLLTETGPTTGTPRLAKVFEGQPATAVVAHVGPYTGPCGASPVAPRWTTRAADRVTQTLHGASTADHLQVVRAALHGGGDANVESALLGRWLDEVVLPSQIELRTPSELYPEVRAYLRGVGGHPPPPAANPSAGRLVPLSDLSLVAEALTQGQDLPRSLPGDLNPTEAFYALLLWLDGRVEDQSVRVLPLLGPPAGATSGLRGPTTFPRESVDHLAHELLSALPERLPASLPLEGQLLTAGELLRLVASCVRGDSPCSTAPLLDPDPNAPGLGWGFAR